jgi:membrane fusion protein (multidrug efflux system)
VATVDSFRLESGPSLSGTLVADRTAQLRPQASGTVLSVRVRTGDRVGAGQVIAVIDTMVLAEQARSARLGLTSAELAAETAERNVARSTQLHAAGAIADRDLEGARNQAAQARAMLEDARARLASANKMRDNAIVRAPFSGTVSELPVSVGDVVQMGGSVVAVVVDPSALELEASVPASYFASLRPGARVEFTVAAHPGRVFNGTVARVNAAVDATTGQLLMYVRVPNADRSLAAGLFAEGRVAIESARGLAIPTTALDARAASPSVKRVRGGKVEVVPVTLGLRDELAERVEVTSGVSRGDTVLVGAAIGTPVGASVRFGAQDN